MHAFQLRSFLSHSTVQSIEESMAVYRHCMCRLCTALAGAGEGRGSQCIGKTIMWCLTCQALLLQEVLFQLLSKQ